MTQANNLRNLDAANAAPSSERALADSLIQGPDGYMVTKILIGINILVFAAEFTIHRIWPSLIDLQFGVDWGPLSLDGQPWRILTSTFVHGDLGHLLGNAVFLWVLGKRMESALGHRTFLFFYLACGLAGSITSLIVHPELQTYGASAAIFGLAGGLISSHGLRIWTLSKAGLWKLALLVLWTAFTIYPSPHIDNAAHVGGILTGLALGAVLAWRSPQPRWAFWGLFGSLMIGAGLARYRNDYVLALAPATSALSQGYPDVALRELAVSLKKRPDSVLANELAAEAYLTKADYLKAEAALEKALARDRGNDHMTYLLGMIYMHTGRCNEAHALALKLGARNVKNPEAWSLNRTPCDMAGVAERDLNEGKVDLAIMVYRIALHDDPDNYRAQLGLANAYRAKGLPAEAAAAEAKAAALQKRR